MPGSHDVCMWCARGGVGGWACIFRQAQQQEQSSIHIENLFRVHKIKTRPVWVRRGLTRALERGVAQIAKSALVCCALVGCSNARAIFGEA